MVRLSVIIPTKNRKEFLKKTVRNVLNQSCPPEELIVIDDGSTDGTTEMVKQEFGDRVVIKNNRGFGPGAARNTGFDISSGEFIKFFDSDDLMTKNTLEAQMQSLVNSSVGCVYSPYFHAVEGKEGEWSMTDPAILQFYPVPKSLPLRRWMIRGLFVTIPGFLFKREFLAKVGPWRTDIIAYEDWDFLWRIASHEPFPIHTNACAFLYRIHGNQTTGGHFNNFERDLDKVKCLAEICSQIRADSSFSLWDRLVLESKLFEVMALYPNEPFFLKFKKEFYMSARRVVSGTLRVKQKLGRLKTGTMWQPMHGALVSEKVWKEYMKNIKE